MIGTLTSAIPVQLFNKLSYKTNWELVIKVVSNISGKYENKIMFMYEFRALQQRNEEINAKKIMSVVKTEKARKKKMIINKIRNS